jgi:hypothetical protein
MPYNKKEHRNLFFYGAMDVVPQQVKERGPSHSKHVHTFCIITSVYDSQICLSFFISLAHWSIRNVVLFGLNQPKPIQNQCIQCCDESSYLNKKGMPSVSPIHLENTSQATHNCSELNKHITCYRQILRFKQTHHRLETNTQI